MLDTHPNEILTTLQTPKVFHLKALPLVIDVAWCSTESLWRLARKMDPPLPELYLLGCFPEGPFVTMRITHQNTKKKSSARKETKKHRIVVYSALEDVMLLLVDPLIQLIFFWLEPILSCHKIAKNTVPTPSVDPTPPSNVDSWRGPWWQHYRWWRLG